ncbi:MAG: MlaD family protein [Pirellulales bacterium]|nr:MlaD family protein [Pirellulales bacterium]
MDERIVQFRVGVMVMAVIIIAVILVLLFGELPTLLQGSYTVYVHFPEVRGVSNDTAVRMHGILIGRVSDVRFAPEGGVLVTARIQKDVRLQQNDVCRSSGSLLGASDLEFVRVTDKGLSTKPVVDGQLMYGMSSPDPFKVLGSMQGDVTVVLSSLGRTSDQIGELAGRVNDLLEGNNDQFSRIIDKAETTLEGLQVAVANVNEIIGDEKLKTDLKQSVAEFPSLLQDARTTLNGLQQTLATVDDNLVNLKGLTEPLGRQGPEIVGNVERSTKRLAEVLDEMGQFTAALNNSQGSLGQLLNDPELYLKLSATVDNVEQLTRRLRPILDDARVFTDKIAREPGRLGVRGALERQAPVKYNR